MDDQHDCDCSSLNQEALRFLDELYQLMKSDAIVKGTDRSTKVLEFLYPEQIPKEIDLTISDVGTSRDDLIAICRKVVKYSVQTGHPRHFNLLYSGLDPAGLGAAWLTESLNCNAHCFEAAPVFVIMENFVLSELCKLVGYPNGEGIFVPGASFGTFMAIHMARYRYNKNLKQTGMFGIPNMCIFTSEEAHYSVSKAASFLGFGTNNVIMIAAESGKMKPDHLEQAILDCQKTGKVALAVVATCGSTVLGGFDPLTEISAVCRRHNVWLHADASWGAGALFSTHHRHLLEGLELSDSMVWSLHKMMGAQIQCAVILLKEKGQLQQCNGYSAEYLFQPDKFYDVSYDVGDKTLQCGRKVDAFKFWFIWKSRGNQGMTRCVDVSFDNARYVTEKIKQTEGFRLVQPEFQYVNICFWYIPVKMRQQPENEEWWSALHKVAPRIKEGMMKRGSMMVAYQPLQSRKFVNFFRLIVGNPATTHEDMDFLLEEIDLIGRDLDPFSA